MCRGRQLGLGWRASPGVTGAFTATGVANRGIRRHSAAPGEYEPGFLNGLRRSVNRKVRGSNPRPGAKFEFKIGFSAPRDACLTTTALQPACRHVAPPR